jgi:hypothetical protein
MSDRNKAFELQERLQENGISDTSLLEYLVNNYFSGAEILGAMESALVNFGLEDEEEDEDFFNEDEEDYNSALLYGVENNQ